MRKYLIVPAVAVAALAFGSSAAFSAVTTVKPAATTAAKPAATTVAKPAATTVAKPAATTAAKPAATTAAKAAMTDKVNINTATKTQLLKVRGIGKKMAADIVKYRPYKDFSKLEQKLNKDFPLKTIQKVEPSLTV